MINPSLSDIKRILFELSNLCNYSTLHKKCPVSKIDTHSILPSRVIYKIVNELQQIDYSGVFSFHRYNEPLIDPRLFVFIKYIKERLPKSRVTSFTNGFYLSQEIADDLCEVGCDGLTISAYTLKEEQRLSKIDFTFPVEIIKQYRGLDDRLDAYGFQNRKRNKPCSRCAPLKELNINANGDIPLCCMDWKNRFLFGNILQSSLYEIINKKEFIDTYNAIASGNSPFTLCSNCIVA